MPRSPYVREFGFRNSGKFCLWNMKYWALKSEIQLKESGIPLKMESRIEVPLKKKKPESSTWNLEPMAWNPESKAVLDRKEKETRFIPCLFIITVICPQSLPSVVFRTIG